jgi:outer membrane protein assembly factor BamB
MADGWVFVGGATGTLFAFGEDCGDSGWMCDPAWTFQGRGTVISSPTVADGVAFTTTDAGYVYALPESGSP